MSIMLTMIIAGWSSMAAIVVFCALSESGELQKIRRRIALWWEETSQHARPEVNAKPAVEEDSLSA